MSLAEFTPLSSMNKDEYKTQQLSRVGVRGVNWAYRHV